MQCFHFLLSNLIDFQNSIQAAVELLNGFMIKRISSRVIKDLEDPLRDCRVKQLSPQVE